MDLFDKCTKYTRADEVKASGMYPYFRAIEANEGDWQNEWQELVYEWTQFCL